MATDGPGTSRESFTKYHLRYAHTRPILWEVEAQIMSQDFAFCSHWLFSSYFVANILAKNYRYVAKSQPFELNVHHQGIKD